MCVLIWQGVHGTVLKTKYATYIRKQATEYVWYDSIFVFYKKGVTSVSVDMYIIIKVN